MPLTRDSLLSLLADRADTPLYALKPTFGWQLLPADLDMAHNQVLVAATKVIGSVTLDMSIWLRGRGEAEDHIGECAAVANAAKASIAVALQPFSHQRVAVAEVPNGRASPYQFTGEFADELRRCWDWMRQTAWVLAQYNVAPAAVLFDLERFTARNDGGAYDAAIRLWHDAIHIAAAQLWPTAPIDWWEFGSSCWAPWKSPDWVERKRFAPNDAQHEHVTISWTCLEDQGSMLRAFERTVAEWPGEDVWLWLMLGGGSRFTLDGAQFGRHYRDPAFAHDAGWKVYARVPPWDKVKGVCLSQPPPVADPADPYWLDLVAMLDGARGRSRLQTAADLRAHGWQPAEVTYLSTHQS